MCRITGKVRIVFFLWGCGIIICCLKTKEETTSGKRGRAGFFEEPVVKDVQGK